MVKLGNERRVAMVAKAAGVDSRRYEITPKSIHQHQRRETRGIAGVVRIMAARKRGTGLRLHRHQAYLAARCLVGEERKRGSAEVGSSAAACDDHVGIIAGLLELLFRLKPDHRLMKQDMIQEGTKRVVGVRARCRLLNRFGDRDAERT